MRYRVKSMSSQFRLVRHEHVAGGHAVHAVHADAREGRHVANRGRQLEGPWDSGPW